MSDLIAIAYPDQEAVERARENLRQAVTDDLIQVEDVVVLIRKEDGAFEGASSARRPTGVCLGRSAAVGERLQERLGEAVVAGCGEARRPPEDRL
jgi:hypothetical protein